MKIQAKHKKSQELGLNTIIIAALAIIVLVVIILIFTGRIGESGKVIEKQQSQFTGNKCEIPGASTTCRDGSDCTEKGGTVLSDRECDSGSCCSV